MEKSLPRPNSEARGLPMELCSKAVADAFEESDAQLRRLIEVIPQQIFISDAKGIFLYANQMAREYHGVTQEEFRAEGFRIWICHPDDRERLLDIRSRSIPQGISWEIEVRLRRKDGNYRWFLVRSKPMLDEHGKVIRWFGTNTEIDDRRRAEERIRLVIDTTPALIHTGRPDGHLDYFNRGWLEFLGVSLDAIEGWNWTSSIHPDDVDGLVSRWREALESGEPLECEARVRRHDGEYRWLLHRKVPMRDEQGRVIKWYGSSLDFDDRKRAEDELRRSEAQLRKLKDELYQENLVLKEEIDQSSMFEEIVGSSEALRRVLTQVVTVAPTDSTVLITGETGTGKELIARAIHKRSRRAGKTFIRVNCAAIAPTLIASELFGHEKGAFTGALQRRIGRFERADGGTIFLDEVGDLPPETQIALLRVLQEREFERVGGSQTISVNVRVVAATNHDLKAAVDDGPFRMDLYYRLNVFPILVPPLRERRDDIPSLVRAFARELSRSMGKTVDLISQRTMDALQAYPWPGNIRELRNIVERGMILSRGNTLEIEPPGGVDGVLPQHQTGPKGSDALEEIERRHILAVLERVKWKVAGKDGAAEILGLTRTTLQGRMQRLGIRRPE